MMRLGWSMLSSRTPRGRATAPPAIPTNSAFEPLPYTLPRQWIQSSLEQYHPELELLPYAVFVHIHLGLIAHGLMCDVAHLMDPFKSDHIDRPVRSI